MGTYNTYTEEQTEFLTTHASGISRRELTDLFNARFGTNKTVLAIKTWCNNRGLSSGNDGRFTEGHTSWQTGMSGEEYMSHFTEDSFKKSIAGLMIRKHDIGDTILKSGELWVVVSVEDNVPLTDRIVIKRRYVYEQAYGKIPKGYRVIHLDGNRLNCELDNLYCIPSKYIPLINKNHWLTDSREHTLTAIKWCELYYALKADGRVKHE